MALVFESPTFDVFLPEMSEQLIEDAKRRLNEATERLREAQNDLTMYTLGQLTLSQGVTVEMLNENVNRFSAMVNGARQTFHNLTSNRGNFD